MKRFHHIPLRFSLSLILLLATALTALGQDISYSPADGSAEYWYVIRFRENTGLVLRCDEDMPRAASYPADSPASDAPDNMKWKIEVSDKGEYYLASKTGRYIYYADYRFRTTDQKEKATQLHLIYNELNAYPYAWQIQCRGNGYSMAPAGGMAEEHEMAQDDVTYSNSALLFEPAEDFEAPIFLQFSSYGRLALYDTGNGNTPEARLPADDIPNDPGFTWVKTLTNGDGYTLRSGNGNYLALGDDGNSLMMTADETKAVVVHTKMNPYAANVFDSGQRLVHRKMYYVSTTTTENKTETETETETENEDQTENETETETETETKIENKAITVNPDDRSLHLTAITPATRATIIRETTKIDAGEPPLLSTDEAPVWYKILFTSTGDYLSISSNESKQAFVRQISDTPEPAMMWRLETTGSTDNPDEFFLKNSNGDYLRWDAANSRFNTTTVSAEAAPFRLAEYIENGPDRDKWALHYVAEKGQAWIQYLKPNDDKNSVGQTPATDADKAALLFKKLVDDEPDYCTTDGTDWRRLFFYDTTPNLNTVLHATTNGVNATTADNTDDCLWKNIKNEDGSFSLKNWDGQYLALNADKTGFTLTTDPEQAARFTAEKSDAGGDTYATWFLTDNETGKVLGKNANGNIVLTDKATAEETPENSSVYLGEKMDIPTPEPEPGEYYTIYLNKYMHDGFDDHVNDAYRSALPTVKDESMVITNDFLWTFIPKDGGYMLQSRDGNYLTWGTDGSFDISTDANDATILGLHFIATWNSSTNTWDMAPRIKALGGTGITDAEKQLWLNFDGRGPILHQNYNPGLSITKYVIHKPEDYTAHKILPKRSWFIKQVEGQEVESNSFIHATEDGSYGMKKFALKDDTGQLTGDSIMRQNTNDYRVVRYMKRSTAREFRLPTSKYEGSATQTRIQQYQRWYNYDTDGLVPDSLLFLNKPASRNYSNGTLIGSVLPFNGQASGSKTTFGFNFKMPDNVPDDFEYTLGIDMSFYTDFVQYYEDIPGHPVQSATTSSNTLDIPVDADLIEPTLASRCIYVVRNAHIMAKQLTALTESQDKWLEEYNVSFPARKVNFEDCSLPLENELANYWIYKDGVEAEENLIPLTLYSRLEFVVKNNNANISLASYPVVQGTNGSADSNADLSLLRFFRFTYPTVDGKEMAANGSTADIEVYAKDGDRRYRLAVYHLTFVDDTELRPYTEILGMKQDENGNDVPKSERSPIQLSKELGEPKAYVTFDFNNYETFQAPPKGKNYATKNERDAHIELPNTYRYPLRYENTSYVFEPTAISDNPNGIFNYTGDVEENSFGSYTIARTTKFNWGNKARFYPVRKYYHDTYPEESQYDYANSGFLYIDASECPGRIASLDFDGNICKGTRITVSAWVSSPNSPNRVGIGGTSYANVFFNILGYYTDANGVEQEEKIYTYCPGPISGDALSATGDTIKSMEGGEGVWQQIYFTFIPHSEHIIERFVLNVNNACTSSQGGDILIDDIEVYSTMPTVRVVNTLPVCSSSVTLTKIEADYETMMNSLGLADKDLKKYHPSINYCVVDSAMYQSKLKELLEAHDDAPANNAMRYAAIGGIRHVTINTTFGDLPEYNYPEAAESGNTRIWRLTDDKGARQIIISDKIVNERMKPNTTYYLAACFTYSNDLADFSTFQVGTECSISSLFTTRTSMDFIINGDIDTAEGGDATVCAGSNVTVSTMFRGMHAQTGEEMFRTLPCDWWLAYYGQDYAQAYINADGSYTLGAASRPADAVSVSEALMSFRTFYPTTATTDNCSPRSGMGMTLTQAMIDGLSKLSHPQAADAEAGTPARPAMLLLYRKNINVLIPDDLGKDDKYIITLQPIENLIGFDDDEALKNCIICFDADTLSIHVDGHAPGLLNGFSGVPYPAYMSNVPLRLTPVELDGLRDGSGSLRLPLRNIRPVTPGVDELVPVTLTDGETTYSPLYIADTDDPACQVFTTDGGLTEVGRVKAMYAVRDAADGYADVAFLSGFAPREGYTYTLRADYREKEADGITPNTCNGSFVFDMKIVPRYAVWTAADGNSEWTNDRNWRRADRSDLLFLDDRTEPDYLTNEANTTAGAFVPLSSTHVIVAADAPFRPVLYDSIVGPSDRLLYFGEHEADVTPDIRYDLIPGGLIGETGTRYCELFRTNRCDGLMLQAGAELLQAQHLDYKTAWAEYELDRGRWYTLGTPLRQVYAGDWYTPTTGRETAPYFHDIHFSTTLHDRFRPAVYQRGWDKGEAKLYYLEDPSVTSPESYNVLQANVAVQAMWSSVYNDVNVCCDRAGFSLKAEHAGSDNKLLFRLPKEDTTYDYYIKDIPGSGGNTATINRDAQHRLWTDSLKTQETFTFHLQNTNDRNPYYLVGNPFPCGLDMNRFFEANADVVEPKYWMLTANGQSAAIKDPASPNWTTVNTTDGAADTPVLAAGQGFFVKLRDGKTACPLTYNAGMMAGNAAGTRLMQKPLTRSDEPQTDDRPRLHIRAERDGLVSEAVILEDETSADGYSPAEDMETLLDECLTHTPVVYTLAGNRATTVNSRRTIRRVGLGVAGRNTDDVTLTFSGMGSLREELSLLDVLTGETTPLCTGPDSISVIVPGLTDNRFFLVSTAGGEYLDEGDDALVSIKAHNGQVTVTAAGTLLLGEVRAVATDGRVFHTATPNATEHRFRLAPGIYLISTRTIAGATTRKLVID